MVIRKSPPLHLICKSVCPTQILFILYFNYLICRIGSMHRTPIRNPLNMVIFTGWFLWKQEMRLNLIIRICQERRQGWAEGEVEQPQKHNRLLVESSGELWFRHSPSELLCLGQKWLDIYTCLNRSSDRDEVGGGKACLGGRNPQKVWQTPKELTDGHSLLEVRAISPFLYGDLDDTFPFFPVIVPFSKSSYTININTKE